MENTEKKRIRFEFMVDDKWKWYAQDKDGTITLFVDKPTLVDDTWDINGEYKTLTLSPIACFSLMSRLITFGLTGEALEKDIEYSKKLLLVAGKHLCHL